MILCSTLSQRAARFDVKAAVRSKEFSPASCLCEQDTDPSLVIHGRFAYVTGQRIGAFAPVRLRAAAKQQTKWYRGEYFHTRCAVYCGSLRLRWFVRNAGETLEDEGFFTLCALTEESSCC